MLSEALLSAAAKLAPVIRRKQVPMGWCTSEKEKAEFYTRCQERQDAKARLRMDTAEKRTSCWQYIKDEKGRLLREIALIRERWVRLLHKKLNTKWSTLDPVIV